MSRRSKKGVQEERDRSTQFSVPSVLHSPDTHRDSQNWIGKRRGREEIEVIWGRKSESKGGKSNHQTPEQKWVLNIGFLNVQN